MGAPKIKIYQLPAGYSQDNDADIQQALNDEMLPVRDKPITPDDFYELTGVKESSSESLSPFDYESGRIVKYLVPEEAEFQAPEGETGIILVAPSGHELRAKVLDEMLDEVAPSGYQMTPSGVRFLSSPYPSGYRISYWLSADRPSKYFYGAHDSWYNGTNHMFRPQVASVTPSGYLPPSGYQMITPSGIVIFPSAVPSGYASYWYETPVTKYFIGHHENWLPPNDAVLGGGHIYMGPDVFKGMLDYEGDGAQEEIPQYVEQTEYSIDFRLGMVTFHGSDFDSETYPVHASFAYFTGVRNTTGQRLKRVAAASGQYVYAASEDADPRFPLSVGARWVNRNNIYMPRNFYIDGNMSMTVTVSPYDVPSVKT